MTGCSFLPLTERDLADGPEPLSNDEQEALAAHLAEGCPECEARIEGGLEEAERRWGGLLGGTLDAAGDAMEPARERVLLQVRARLADDEAVATRRRARRRIQRVLVYVTLLVLVCLLVIAYAGLRAALRLTEVRAQREAVAAELAAMQSALVRYVQDGGAIPNSWPELLEALQRPRRDGRAPYYRFDAERLRGSEYLDGFGHPYRYLAVGGRALLYSVGPDGRDQGGGGGAATPPVDDVGQAIQFVR